MDIFGLSSWKISVVPQLYRLLVVDTDHGRTNQEQTKLKVQHAVWVECDFEYVQHFLVRYVAKLRKTIWDSFGENGAILVESTNILIGSMRKIVHSHHRLLLCPQQPHPLVRLQHFLTVNGDFVLLHRLSLRICSPPHLAVAIIEDWVVSRLWKLFFCGGSSHFI